MSPARPNQFSLRALALLLLLCPWDPLVGAVFLARLADDANNNPSNTSQSLRRFRWGLVVRSALFPCRRSQSRVRRDRSAPLHLLRPSPRFEIVARSVCLIHGYKARVVSLAPSNRTAPGPPLSGSREEACRRCRSSSP
jgi:hypothetical protein